MNKEELRRVLDKPNPFAVFIKKCFKSLKKGIIKHKEDKWFWVLAFVICVLLFGGFYMMINEVKQEAFRDGYRVAKSYCQKTEKEITANYLEDKSVGDVASWFAKKGMISIGNNLTILFVLIGICWLLHGVGFRII